MKKIFYTSVLLFIATMALTTSTSCSGKSESRENLEAACSAGRQRALALHPDSIARTAPRGVEMADNPALQSTLLDIRRREAALREAGHPRAAEAYISSFLATLDSVNPALAADLR